jgi:hypothetical protein
MLKSMAFAMAVGLLAGVLAVALVGIPVLYGVAVWMLFFAGGSATVWFLHHTLPPRPTLRP